MRPLPSFLSSGSSDAWQAAAGDLDRSFSGDGRQTTDFAGGGDEGEAVAVQADGKIVVAGSSHQGDNRGSDFALARYNADGTLDRSFSGDGRQTTDFAGDLDVGERAANPIVNSSRHEGPDCLLALAS